MPPCNCHPPFPRPEPFSPLPRPGHVPDWGKWIRDRLAEKGALLAFPSASAFPNPGAWPNLYLDLETGVVYRWDREDYAVLVDPREGNDVLVYDSVAAFPGEGEQGKLYMAANTGSLYRWGGEGYVALLPGKADKAAPAAAGNLAALDAGGNLVDSTKKPADFATAAQGGRADTAVQPAAIARFVDGAEYVAEYGDAGKPTILLKHGDSVIAEVDATDFVIDGMVSDVKIENGNLVITFNTDSGKLPISIPLTSIFNPDNYYNKTAADGKFVAKADVAATVTQDGANPVKSSGVWSALWGALAALPTGFTSLYDWCAAQLAGKASTSDATLTERTGFTAWTFSPSSLEGGTFSLEFYSDEDVGDNWFLSWAEAGGTGTIVGFVQAGRDSTNLSFELGNYSSLPSELEPHYGETITATRTVLPGYRLGPDVASNPNRDKLLASEAEAEALRTSVAEKYAKPSGGIPATDLAAAVQTSLGKADTAFPESDATVALSQKQDRYTAWTVTMTPPSDYEMEAIGQPYYNSNENEWRQRFKFREVGETDWSESSDATPGALDAIGLTSSVFTATRSVIIDGKANRAANPTAGNLAALDATGNPVDSGKKPADFATAAQGQQANTALQGVKIGSSPVTPDSDRVVSLGTAAAKDVPTSGNASASQVVMGNDSRLPKAEDSVQRELDNATPSAKTAVTIGVRSTEAVADRGQASLAVGDRPKASGKNAVATGTWTQATGQDAHAEGNLSQATNYGAHAEGNNTQATGAYAHAEGTDTVASGLVSHAEGNYATAEGTGAHAEGMFAKASGVAAHAEGSNLDKLADLLQAAGASAEIVALFRQAATCAAGSFSHTEGLVSATSGMGSHAQGFRASDGGNQFSFVWQGYSGQVPTAAQMQALLDDPTSQDAQIALQCLRTALTARAAYTSKGPGAFCVNPVPASGSTDPKTGFFVGDESLDKALCYSFHTVDESSQSGFWNFTEVPSGVDISDVDIYWDPDYEDWCILNVSTGDNDFIGRHDENDRSPISYNGYVADWVTVPQRIYNLANRAVNTATIGSTFTAATVTLPASVTGRSRDFYIDLTIEATDAPTLTFIDPATSTTANVAFGADSLADIAPGDNLVLWTELPNNRWLISVKHEEAS